MSALEGTWLWHREGDPLDSEMPAEFKAGKCKILYRPPGLILPTSHFEAIVLERSNVQIEGDHLWFREIQTETILEKRGELTRMEATLEPNYRQMIESFVEATKKEVPRVELKPVSKFEFRLEGPSGEVRIFRRAPQIPAIPY